jgi:predicted HTH transcriptional regulator
MDTIELRRIIRKGETQHIDFKKCITQPEKIAKTLTAFANSNGGTIFVGITDQQEVVGIDPEEEKYVLENAALNYCSPPIRLLYTELVVQNSQEKNVTVLMVNVYESSTKPHFVLDKNGNKLLYIRLNDKSILVNQLGAE